MKSVPLLTENHIGSCWSLKKAHSSPVGTLSQSLFQALYRLPQSSVLSSPSFRQDQTLASPAAPACRDWHAGPVFEEQVPGMPLGTDTAAGRRRGRTVPSKCNRSLSLAGKRAEGSSSAVNGRNSDCSPRTSTAVCFPRVPSFNPHSIPARLVGAQTAPFYREENGGSGRIRNVSRYTVNSRRAGKLT